MGAVEKSYMRKGFHEERLKYLVIYEEAVSHLWLCNRSLLDFLIYEENFIFFFTSVPYIINANWNRWANMAGLVPGVFSLYLLFLSLYLLFSPCSLSMILYIYPSPYLLSSFLYISFSISALFISLYILLHICSLHFSIYPSPYLLCRWFRFAQLAKGKKFRP